MNKLFEWILITVVIIAFTIEIVMVCKSIIVIQERMNDMIEKIDAEGDTRTDTLKPWCEVYYYGDKGIRIKSNGVDTTVMKGFNFSIDNSDKTISFWNVNTVTF